MTYLWARVLLAEALGTCMIVLFGCGSVCSSLTGAYAGIWQVATVWGLGVSFAIYCTASVSGAHLNPAVSLAFWLVRPKVFEFPDIFGPTTPLTPDKKEKKERLRRGWAFRAATLGRCLQFQASQFIGAIAGGAINLFVYSGTIQAFERREGITRGEPRSILSAKAFGEYFPNPDLNSVYSANGAGVYQDSDVSVLHALFTEAWGTFVLTFVIFVLTHPKTTCFNSNPAAPRPAVPFLIGFTVAMLLALYAPITQAGWNPARDFGPRLVAFLAGWGNVAIPGPRNGFWIYIIGPFIGGPLAAAFVDLVYYTPDTDVEATEDTPAPIKSATSQPSIEVCYY